eukprot:3663167-Rhodomonas_salina.3
MLPASPSCSATPHHPPPADARQCRRMSCSHSPRRHTSSRRCKHCISSTDWVGGRLRRRPRASRSSSSSPALRGLEAMYGDSASKIAV